MRIMVYRTQKNVIEGAVLTFVNIDDQKSAQKELEQYTEQAVSIAREYAESIVDSVREALLVLDKDRRVITANRRFYDTFQTSAEQTEGFSLFELEGGQWDVSELRGLLDEIVEKDKAVEDYPVDHHSKDAGSKRLRLTARQLRGPKHGEERILLAIEDVSGSG
jgi:two-component system CheB/CheR fusion protein